MPGQLVTDVIETNQITWHPDYTVKKQPIRTALAASVYYVYFGSTRIAEVLTDVDSCVIDAMTVFVRFDNVFLYGKNLYERTVKFLEDNQLQFHNWTRFDVACDFNYLLSRRGRLELKPNDFIRSFFNEDIKLVNRRRAKKTKSKTGRVDNGRKGGCYFECSEAGIEFQTLYLGSPLSAVRPKLYNKSRELQQKEDKPHIRAQWELNGLCMSDIETKTQVDVWRLEFCIMDFGTKIVDRDGVAMDLKTLDILKDENIETIWNALQDNYFNFYKEDGKKNVTRKERLQLFEKQQTGYKLVKVVEKENTTRATKVFVKKLLETQAQLRKYHTELKSVTWATDYVGAYLVARHDLHEWAKMKFPEWQCENYLEPPSVDIPVVQYTLKNFGTDSQTMKAEKHRYTFEASHI